MHFAEAVAAFEIQLQANQRSRHTVRSYLRDLGMLRAWLDREGHADFNGSAPIVRI
jgi:site-specific recombinase XerD